MVDTQLIFFLVSSYVNSILNLSLSYYQPMKFFTGIPGCAKSALCKEILNASGGLGDDRPIQSLMGDLIKGMGFLLSFLP